MITSLPIFYEVDRCLKNIEISASLIQKCPVLELIYHKDGRRKTYRELMLNKEQYLNVHKNQESVVKKNSIAEYKDKKVIASAHINSIYDGIIKSDPLLHIEDSLNHGRINVIDEILTNCPRLLEVYKNELSNLFV